MLDAQLTIPYANRDTSTGWFYFKVNAVNSIGSSPFSAISTITVDSLPHVIENLTASNLNENGEHQSGTVTLSFSYTIDNTCPLLLGYFISYLDTVNNDLDTIFVQNTNPNVNYTIHGLTDGITYDFNIYAMNSLGIGEGVDIQAIPSTIPDAPQFSFVGHGDGYVAMHWTAPNSNGSDIYEYRIFKSDDGEIYGQLLAILPATTFEYEDGLLYEWS
jgi:hypothetical protein